MNNKKTIRLDERTLHRIVKESVMRILQEGVNDDIRRKFVEFFEKYRGGVLLQGIVDYESGNETGTPESPVGWLISEFEDNVLNREATPEEKREMQAAYNEWWYYAEAELMSEEEEFQ